MTFSLYLQSNGHSVVTARSASEALALWPLSPHDLLFCDLRLRDGDGWELLGRLIPCPTYAVAFSGLSSAEDRAKRKVALEFNPDQRTTKSQAA